MKHLALCTVRLPLAGSLLALWLVAAAATQGAEIPELDSIDYIYVLGPFDIPDGAMPGGGGATADVDGLQDRERKRIWERGVSVDLSDTDRRLYGEAAVQVLEMLGSNYRTVDSDTWNHKLHRTGVGQQGGIVLLDGTIIGWKYEMGGMGYLDFDYDPDTERVAYWKPLRIDEAVPEPRGRIYRVRNCERS